MKKRTHLFVIGVILFVLIAGCAGFETSKVCNSIPSGEYSVLCNISKQVNTSPEEVGTIVKVSVLVLMGDAFTAEQAYNFLGELEKAAKDAQAINSITYDQLVNYVATKYLGLPPKVQAAIEIIKAFYGVKLSDGSIKILSPYDWSIIIDMLADQKATIQPFI